LCHRVPAAMAQKSVPLPRYCDALFFAAKRTERF
jgi:hypothetical protein